MLILDLIDLFILPMGVLVGVMFHLIGLLMRRQIRRSVLKQSIKLVIVVPIQLLLRFVLIRILQYRIMLMEERFHQRLRGLFMAVPMVLWQLLLEPDIHLLVGIPVLVEGHKSLLLLE